MNSASFRILAFLASAPLLLSDSILSRRAGGAASEEVAAEGAQLAAEVVGSGRAGGMAGGGRQPEPAGPRCQEEGMAAGDPGSRPAQ